MTPPPPVRASLRDHRRNIEINLGKACNNRCLFCLDGLPKTEDRRWIDLTELMGEIDRYAHEGFRSLGFLGGEPTTYRYLPEAIAHARAVGFSRVVIATNATRLRKPEYLERLVDAGLTRVTVSTHGHTAALEDRLTGVPGNFEKKGRALRLLMGHHRASRLPDGVSVNIVLNGLNHAHLPRMLRYFFETLDIPDVRANFIRSEGHAEGNAEITPRLRDVVPSLIKAIVLNERHFQRTFTFGGFPLCVLPASLVRDDRLLRRYMGEYRDLATACSIRSDGGDRIAPALRNGTLASGRTPTDSVVAYDAALGRARFSWQERKRVDLKAKPPVCDGCELSGPCEGVWKAYLDVWGAADLAPVRLGDTALLDALADTNARGANLDALTSPAK